MKNRFTTLLVFLAAFMFTAPAMAAPETDDVEAEAKTDDASPDAEEAKSDGEAKTDDTSPDAEEAKSDEDAKSDGETGASDEDADADKDVVETDEEAAEAAGDLVTAIQQKHWALAIGLGLSLLVFFLRKANVLAKVPKRALPWVTAALCITGYIAVSLQAGGPVMDAVWGGAVTGAASVGLWEMVLKHFLGSKTAEGESAG